MPHFLPGTKSLPARGRCRRHFGNAKFLASRGEKLGNIVDRVAVFPGVRGDLSRLVRRIPASALILVLVGIVAGLGRDGSLGGGASGPRPSGGPHVFSSS